MVGIYGLAEGRDEANRLYSDNLQTTLLVQRTAGDIDNAFQVALELIPANDAATQRRLNRRLAAIDSEVYRDIGELMRPRPGDTARERAAAESIEVGWRRFLAVWRSGAFDVVGNSAAVTRHNAATARKVVGILNPVSEFADRLAAKQAGEAEGTTLARSPRTGRAGQRCSPLRRPPWWPLFPRCCG